MTFTQYTSQKKKETYEITSKLKKDLIKSKTCPRKEI
jgi:hypothetical protein